MKMCENVPQHANVKPISEVGYEWVEEHPWFQDTHAQNLCKTAEIVHCYVLFSLFHISLGN